MKFFALGVTEENVSIWLTTTTGTLEAEVLNIYKYIYYCHDGSLINNIIQYYVKMNILHQAENIIFLPSL